MLSMEQKQNDIIRKCPNKDTCYQWRKAKRHNSEFSKVTDVIIGGKQNDIILKFQNSDDVNRRKHGEKQNYIIFKFLPKTDVVNG